MGPKIRRFAPLALLLCGAGIVVVLAPWAREPQLLWKTPGFLASFGIAFVLYGVAGAVAALLPSESSRRAGLLAILAVAVAARLALLPAEPSLSIDLYRYLWDGKVTVSGHNPYSGPPDSPRLAALRGEMWQRTGDRTVYSPYPPVAQALFALAAWIRTDSVVVMKILLILIDLAACFIVAALLRGAGRPASLALLYAWNPLVLSEVALSGHVDVLAITLFLLALFLLSRRGDRWAGTICLGLSIAGKPWALAAVPLLARWRGPRLLAAPAIAAATYLPFAGAGAALLRGMAQMAGRGARNASIYDVAERALHGVVASPDSAARLLMAALAGSVILALAWHRVAGQDDLWRRLSGTFLVVLLCSNVVYPWYVLWITPFLALSPSLTAFVFSAVVSLRHVPPPVPPGMHARLLWQYVPLYVVLAGDLAYRRLRARRSTGSPEGPTSRRPGGVA